MRFKLSWSNPTSIDHRMRSRGSAMAPTVDMSWRSNLVSTALVHRVPGELGRTSADSLGKYNDYRELRNSDRLQRGGT